MEGLQHSVLVKVPIALMDKAGEYRFVISAKGSHADREKGHRQKWALERNQKKSDAVINLQASDLFKSALLENEGEPPGAFVHFNLDNDNNSDNDDGAPKHPGGDYLARTNVVSGEDDLKRAKVFFAGGLPSQGKVVLRMRHVSGDRKSWVWKSATKGAGNEVLVDTTDVIEKEWDLSNSQQRSEFMTVMNDLWVEGRSYNGVSWLEVEHQNQGQVVGSDKVKYTFIAADDGDQPRTVQWQIPYYNQNGNLAGYTNDPNQKARWKGWFPNLKDCEFSIIENQLSDYYNCIAWSVDERGPWWYTQVQTIPGTNRKGIDEEFGSPQNGVFEMSDLDAFYRLKKGWTPNASGAQDAEAMYYSGYHAARRRQCSCGRGKWIMYESKCGKAERIEHVWDQLNGGSYGSPTRFYK